MAKAGLGHPSEPVLLLLLVFLLAAAAAAERWDGVVITQADYEGLQAFKRELVDPSGVLGSWNGTGLGACSGAWLGIKCVRGQVIAIQLPWRGLGGHISAKVGQLTALRKLSLHDNSIGGQIPAALGLLPALRGLYLFNNLLAGSIPAPLGSSPLLQTLDLSNNSLAGEIPASLSNSSKLYRLNLGHNRLSGSIPPSLAASPSLAFLSLDHNNLSGAIPDAWLAGSPLDTLNLDHNSLAGRVPVSLRGLPKLRVLTLGHNGLSGGFPSSLCNSTSLVELRLESNRLSGVIPAAVGGLRGLAALSLADNRFTGTIPAELGKLAALSELDLSGNHLTGGIPEPIARLRNLTAFDVSNNNLSGAVPPLLAERFNSFSFAGNRGLCGYAADVPCPAPPSTHPTLPAAPAGKESPSSSSRLTTRDIILIAAGGVLAALLVVCCVLLCCLMRKRSRERSGAEAAAAASAAARGEKPEGAEAGESGGKLVHFEGPLVFTADDLLCATAEIMGKSTYGTVYKATLEDGAQVAVKRLREKIAKGQREFEAEVNALGKMRHPNLLSLRAYYLGPKGEKLLVFDYMPKGSVAAFLHARGPETPVDWPTRMKIAIGTAKGLHHLHTHENIVHGNLTGSNVLLDEDACPRIADFGLSRLMSAAANSNVIATAGALGYRAPELSKLKKANTKTDVYSLGVIILELLTGKSPSEATNGADLPQWVASIVKEEWTNEVFDLELMRGASGATGDELLNALKLALHCVDPSPSARPEVQQVLQQLEEIKPELAGASSGTGGGGESRTAGGGGAGKEEEAPE